MSLLPKNIDPSWGKLLSNDFIAKLNKIENELSLMPVHVSSGYAYFPKKQAILRFLQQDLMNAKCIILGMEPYPSWYTESGTLTPVATGRSFEIGNVDDWSQKFKQSSLRNMLKTVYYNQTADKISLQEVRDKIGNDSFKISQPHQWFDLLEQQGVIFLNATLTVEPDNTDSHTKLWADVMNEIIMYINNNYDIKWLLFGDKAQKIVISVLGNADNLYKCYHPRIAEFVDENIFKHVPEINWVV